MAKKKTIQQKAYELALSGVDEPTALKKLGICQYRDIERYKIFNRGYSKGFFEASDKRRKEHAKNLVEKYGIDLVSKVIGADELRVLLG